MAFAYSIKDQTKPHFVTFTVHQWVDVFTRKEYVDEIIKSLIYCQNSRHLLVFGWVIMSNHMHLIIQADRGDLSDIIRDFKKFTSRELGNAIKQNPKESRKQWLTALLDEDLSNQFWKAGYHGEEIFSDDFMHSKLDYIHQNPVKAGIVDLPEEYRYSSARDFYTDKPGLIPLAEI